MQYAAASAAPKPAFHTDSLTAEQPLAPFDFREGKRGHTQPPAHTLTLTLSQTPGAQRKPCMLPFI